MNVSIYTDGSCLGNPGPGGYAAILQAGPHEKIVTGRAADTTNNRMELLAVIEGLKALKRPCQVTLVTDSQYVVNILNQSKARVNLDLVKQLRELAAQHEIAVQQVAGHGDHKLNNRANKLAQNAAKSRN